MKLFTPYFKEVSALSYQVHSVNRCCSRSISLRIVGIMHTPLVIFIPKPDPNPYSMYASGI